MVILVILLSLALVIWLMVVAGRSICRSDATPLVGESLMLAAGGSRRPRQGKPAGL